MRDLRPPSRSCSTAPSRIDFSASTGLDISTGSPQPSVRFAATLDGFVGQATVGVGFRSGSSLRAVTANGSFSTAMLTGLAVYSPISYVVSELRDDAGALQAGYTAG